jgi:hypothetical protein
VRNAAFATFAALVTLAACSGGGKDAPPTARCDGGDVAFVKAATLATLGRRPTSQDEVHARTAELSGAAASDPAAARARLVRTLATDPEFVERWSEVLMDHLRVQRSDLQTQIDCYGGLRRAPDDGALARYVRDHDPRDPGDGGGEFNARDLLRSAIVLDDLSPALRGHLFALMRVPMRTCNLPAGATAELSRRKDFGNWFDTAFLNRDMSCLRCHNSEASVTYSDDPAKNRHWPLPGRFEEALYGSSAMGDAVRAHAVFRYDGLRNCPSGDACVYVRKGPGQRPWGWSAEDCGELYPDDLGVDPAMIEARFGSITGAATVYDLEASLARGVAALAAHGLVMDAQGRLADADAAFAYLVAASLVESVWREVIGTPLTIANHFPRNQAARDLLKTLTDRFVSSHFSLRELLVAIALTPYFDPSAPAAGCGAAPYTLAAVYDPWTISEEDPELRHNSPADGVQPLSARTLLRASYAALGQTPDLFMFYPGGPFSPDALTPEQQRDLGFLRGVGAFLNNGETGFRGLDFQARLLWEERFGGCPNRDGTPDYIDGLLARARASDATVRDVVLALKDRLLSEPRIDEDGGADGEAALLVRLYGAALEAPAASVPELEARVRRHCGVLLASPQFVLGGLPEPEALATPVLNRQP